ncbi:MAG: cell shape determination protein CcmA [Rhodospirillaceae bacterium]|nr:cell shape determination protein CcmA [Rhodospirillaceae bacterium]|tara:strand:- start:1004 stop:1456 length:453 start_codon:yes stop_codon:yes gene_type:complete
MAEENRAATEVARRVLNIPGARRTESIGDAQGKKLIVGREICLTGEISACDTLVVEGRVEAELSDSRTIEIAETGVFKGEIEINVAEINGQFEGALTARSRLVIHSKGNVKGRIRYAEIEVERGGRIEGDVQLISDAEIEEISSDPPGEG